MAYLLKKRRSALPIFREKGRMTMATCLSNSLDSLQYQDPPLTCRMRGRGGKLDQGGHGLGRHLLDGHLRDTCISSREEVCPSSPKAMAYLQEKEGGLFFLFLRGREG